ncbi:FtsK/SpoIIIE domain-containing protein [Kineococcus xinjiangensis]|uniref:FtsK/SpoIIIE domain-containing protein n=1 Tax=Kineococcus xinjiangensis TaxID=512762 RepID=UPI0011B0AC61|nr:FtsK/SpoIIIE domain-containing protein [Kineococcus xinjiangensis]
MLLRLTVTARTCGGPRPRRWAVDVEVAAAPGTPWCEVEREVRALTPDWPGRPRVAGTVLAPDAPVGSAPLLHGAVLDVGEDAAPRPATRAAARASARATAARVVLAVTGGPDAGRRLSLPRGTHVLGRGSAPEQVADEGLSRRHLLLHAPAGPAGAEVEDLGSANGSWLERDGERRELGARQRLDVPGQRLVAGSSTFALLPAPPPPAACTGDGAGHVLLNRAPRLRPGTAERLLRLPAEPAPGARPAFPWLAASVPLVLAVVMAIVWSPLSLLLGLASPVLVLGQWWSDRRGGARRDEGAQRQHREQCDAVRADLAEALAAEHAERHRAAPDAVSLLDAVRTPGRRLWERTADADDALRLRLGSGDLPAASCGLHGEPDASVLRGVPVEVDLGAAGVLGVCGPRTAVLGVARFLLGQVATWHSPDEVAVAVLAADEDAEADWGWTAWLPHTRSALEPGAAGAPASRTAGCAQDQDRVQRIVAELLTVVGAGRRQAGGPSGPGARRRVVLLLDGAQRLRSLPGVADLLREGPDAGVSVICLEEDPARLPAECRALLSLPAAGTGEASLSADGQQVLALRADATGAAWAWDVARSLAPLRDATPAPVAATLPATVRLVDLLRRGPAAVDAHDATSVAAAWRREPASTRVLLGHDGRAALSVDLAVDGPHALVAGTTGSGKSELLQALVAALAVGNRPEELQFVLVDYKGGSAFAECAALPHCAGLVTDLDEHLTRRALRSLTAEVRRRERLLRAAGANDLAALRAAAGPGGSCPPRLVLVVDEFRVLAEELPDFVGGLVRIAAVGRSLGIHLVLATQRPAGVVSADIRANTNLRIALRVQDRADGVDVVGVADPALLDERTPGRAVLRSGGGAVRTVQVARVGGAPPAPAGARVRVRPVRFGAPAEQSAAGPSEAAEPPEAASSDLRLLVAALRAAAVDVDAEAPASPWLPPLPERVASADLPPPAVAGTALPWGLLDLPDLQERRSATWDLAEGQHLLVVGTVRSGRSTLVRTLLAAAGAPPPAPVHCYVLDAGGTLADLDGAPHVGAVVGPEELWRAGRVLARLLAEVESRRALFASLGVRSLEEQQGCPGAGRPLPYLLLAVDGWDTWSRVLAEADPSAADAVPRLLREGSALGVRVLLTGDRGLLTSAVASAAGCTVLLRLSDRADAALAGVDPRQVPLGVPAGRGLRVRDGRAEEVQVALPPAAAAARAAAARAAAAGARPWRVRPLPARCSWADTAPAPADAGGRLPPLLLGSGGDEAAPVHLDLGAPGSCALVAGPPGSGRSWALALLAARTAAAGWPVALVRPTAAAAPPASLGCFAPGTGRELAAALDAARADGREALVLVDDLEELLDSDVEEVVLRRLAARGGERVVGAGRSADLAAAYRGLAVSLRRSGSGLLLGAGPRVDGEALGLRSLLAPGPGPGAGFLVAPGTGAGPVPVRLAGFPGGAEDGRGRTVSG